MKSQEFADYLTSHKLLSDEQVEEITGIKRSTLAAWRARGKRQNSALRYVKLGGKVRYRAADVAEFIESSYPSSEAV